MKAGDFHIGAKALKGMKMGEQFQKTLICHTLCRSAYEWKVPKHRIFQKRKKMAANTRLPAAILQFSLHLSSMKIRVQLERYSFFMHSRVNRSHIPRGNEIFATCLSLKKKLGFFPGKYRGGESICSSTLVALLIK